MMGSMMRRGAISGDGSTLTLDFTSGVLDSRLTFTRGSTGTRINASGFVETMSNNFARFDHDPTTTPPTPRGLLVEAQATNLLLQSNDWNTTWNNPAQITWNGTTYTTAPDGTNTAKQITVTAGSSSAIGQAAATGTNRTISVWLKAGSLTSFSIGAFESSPIPPNSAWGTNAESTCSIISGPGSVSQQVGGLWSITGLSTTAWTRIQIFRSSSFSTFLAYPGSSGTGINGTAFMWGMQMEAGNGASSLIPTGASTATRNPDNCELLDLTTMGFNASAGTIYTDVGTRLNTGSQRNYTFLPASGGNNQIFEGSGIAFNVYASGSFVAQIGTSTLSAQKIAAAYALNDYAVSVAGGAVVTDTSGALPTSLTKLTIGGSIINASAYANGCIRVFKYWPTRLPNATLQSLTT
jgi:hypothetical protein